MTDLCFFMLAGSKSWATRKKANDNRKEQSEDENVCM